MDIFEIKRKSFHIVGGFFLIFLIYLNILTVPILVGLLMIGLILSLICKFKRVPIIHWFLHHFEREHYKESWPGKSVVFFLLGALIVTLLFDKDIAIASLLVLTLGDGISPLVGIHYGRLKHPFSSIKFIEGTIVGTMAAFLGIMIFTSLGLITIAPLHALLASFIAMFVEGIEMELRWDLNDDNVILPVVSGLIIWLLQLI